MDARERLEWLLQRQTGIGASDAPNLVGCGFGDALKVYRDKTTPPPVEYEPQTGPLARGIALEPYVADRYAALMDVPLLKPARAIYWNPKQPLQLASPDRVRQDNGRPVQLKTVAGFGDEWGPSGSDQVPDGYTIQVCQETGCLGADACDLAALDILSWELRVYRVAFDRDLFEWLASVEERFWFDHVLIRRPPTAEWEAQFDAKKLGLIADRGARIDLSAEPGAEELFEKLKDLGELKDDVESAYKDAREQLQALMGRAERADCGPWTVKKVIVGPSEVAAKPAHTKPGYTYLGKPSKRKDKK